MKKLVMIIITVFAVLAIMSLNSATAQTASTKAQKQTSTVSFNPIGKETAVLNVRASYGLEPTNNNFLGGDASFVELKVVYHKNGIMTTKDMNKIHDLGDNDPKDDGNFVYETIRVTARNFKNPQDYLSYAQFKRMHYRLKKAGTVRIEWMTPTSSKNYTPVSRVKYDGSDAILVYPSRLSIVKKKSIVPGRNK